MKCIVYKYTSPRDKTYIGKTTQQLDDRIKQHISMATRSSGMTNICREIRYHYREYGEYDIYNSFEVLKYVHWKHLDSVEDEEIYMDQLTNPTGNLNMIGGKYRRFRR